MGPFEVLWIATVAGGVALGYWISHFQHRLVFKRFSAEMHRQYLLLLEKHGIKLNAEGKEALNDPYYKSEREESLLQLRSENRSVDDS